MNMDARAATLIAASILDNFLETAISTCFVKLSKSKFNALFRDKQAPFSSFANKISVAHALGIYNDLTRSQLDEVRAIRNAFAHTMQPIDFDHFVISAACNNLNPSLVSGKPFASSSPRERFMGTIVLLGIAIVSFTRDRKIAIRDGSHHAPTAYACKFELQPLPRNSKSRLNDESSSTPAAIMAGVACSSSKCMGAPASTRVETDSTLHLPPCGVNDIYPKEMFAKIWRKQTKICKTLPKKLGRG